MNAHEECLHNIQTTTLSPTTWMFIYDNNRGNGNGAVSNKISSDWSRLSPDDYKMKDR